MSSPQQARVTSSEQLEVLYDLTRKLATFTELDEVVQYATERTRELFQAEGCALLLLDQERREFFFPVASQRDSSPAAQEQLAQIRFPADQGIAGWVLTNDEAAAVEDAANDPRFYAGVDIETKMQTGALLCAPLRAGSESIGVIEVVNPAADSLAKDRLRFLETIGNEIAVAYEKTALYEQLRGEIISLRSLSKQAGATIAGLGGILAVLTAFVHRARVLPWPDLFVREGFWIGLVLVLCGVGLTVMARDTRNL